ncbi:MAG: radical SAM protein [Candidatus Zixiibacteriota bacterium]
MEKGILKYSDKEIEILEDCRICPRECGVNRFEQKGTCGMGVDIYVSSVNLHFGEEPPISGSGGSGTVFLSGCNMNCIFCQNYPISQMGHGAKFSVEKLAKGMVNLQKRGAHNINFVTPSHYVVQVRRVIITAREMGLEIPIVYNTSGYDSIEALRFLEGYIDIYMPDIRYALGELSKKYSGVDDYPEINRLAIEEMHRQVGDLEIGDDGIAKKGLIVRHLLLPENISATDKAMKFLTEEISMETYVSFMSQYFPAHKTAGIERNNYKPMHRRINAEEYYQMLKYLEDSGIQNGWIQPCPEENL